MKTKHHLLRLPCAALASLALMAAESPPPGPVITLQPRGQQVAVGGTAAFRALAVGEAPLAYRWRRDGVDLPGATNAEVVLGEVQPAQAGSYDVVVSDASGFTTSRMVSLRVGYPPGFVEWPRRQSVAVGANVTFTAIVASTPPLRYTWTRGGQVLSEFYTTNEVSTNQLILTNVQAQAAGVYAVTVSGPGGGSAVEAELAVYSGTQPPFIIDPPASLTTVTGRLATLSVTAAGAAPLAYQWRQNGQAITNATNAVHGFFPTLQGQEGVWDVIVSNSAGVVTSSPPARLTLLPASRRFEIGLMTTNATQGARVPINLIADTNVSQVSFSLAFDPAVLSQPVVRLDEALGQMDTNVVLLPQTTNGGVTLHSLATNVAFATNYSVVGQGLLGAMITLPPGSQFRAGQHRLVTVDFNVALGIDPGEGGLAFSEQPVATRLIDTTGGELFGPAFVLPSVGVNPVSAAPDPQSGLFGQVLRVANPGSDPMNDVRILIQNLGNDSLTNAITAFNASGTNSAGVPFIQLPSLGRGQILEVPVEYYISDRRTLPAAAAFTVEVLPFHAPRILTTWVQVTISTPQYTNGVVYLDFPTAANYLYYVLYADSPTAAVWDTSIPPVPGTGSRVQWADYGPPKTLSKPSTNRFYRVVVSN